MMQEEEEEEEEDSGIEVSRFPKNRICEPRFFRNLAPYPSCMIPQKQDLWTAILQESSPLS